MTSLSVAAESNEYSNHYILLSNITSKLKLCGLSLLLVLYSALRGFPPGTPVFPSLQKPTFPNSNHWNLEMSILECPGISNESLKTPGAPWVFC